MLKIHKSLWPLALLALCALFSGCASSVGLNNKDDGSYTLIEIQVNDPEVIKAAAIEVFTEDGFRLVSDTGDLVRFKKDGGTLTSIVYSTSFLTERTTINPELTLTPNEKGDGYLLNCEVYIREHFKALESKTTRLTRNGRSGYMKLLKQIKATAEGSN